MKRIPLFLAVIATAGTALANDDALVRHQYDEQMAAVNSGTVSRLMATIDPSFTQVDENGKTIHYAEYKAGLTQVLTAFKSGTLKFKLGPIKYANGIATVDYHLEGDLIGAKGFKLHDIEEGRDTWKKVGGKYLQVHEVVRMSKQSQSTGGKTSTSV